LTKFSAYAAVGWLGYSIYLLRTPDEQQAPDPSKKTLVILGKLLSLLRPRIAVAVGRQLTILPLRYWLGRRLSTQET